MLKKIGSELLSREERSFCSVTPPISSSFAFIWRDYLNLLALEDASKDQKEIHKNVLCIRKYHQMYLAIDYGYLSFKELTSHNKTEWCIAFTKKKSHILHSTMMFLQNRVKWSEQKSWIERIRKWLKIWKVWHSIKTSHRCYCFSFQSDFNFATLAALLRVPRWHCRDQRVNNENNLSTHTLTPTATKSTDKATVTWCVLWIKSFCRWMWMKWCWFSSRTRAHS